MNDRNSILEVYLEYLNNNIKGGIKHEPIGFVPSDDRFKIYMISNKKLKFCVCGTDYKKLTDKRFKDVYKLLKNATFFIYPIQEDLQRLNSKNYNIVVQEITSKMLDSERFDRTNDVIDIEKYLSI